MAQQNAQATMQDIDHDLDQLVEMTGVDAERASALIMAARAAWFEPKDAE